MTTFQSTQRLGTTPHGYIVVQVELRQREGEHMTITHGTVVDPMELSLMGDYYFKGDRKDNPTEFGQIVDALDSIIKPAPGWTLEEIHEVRDLWARWHLNTTKAGCAHMPEDANARWRARETVACSEGSGYTYGSRWLVEPLPDEVADRIRHLFRDRTHDLYLARGYDAFGNAYPPKEG